MMRVGFGVTVLAHGLMSNGVDGIGSYTRELLKRVGADSQVEVHPFAFGANHSHCCAFRFKKLAPFKVGGLISAATGLPFWGSEGFVRSLDLLHATDHLIPKINLIPVVATLMDAIPLAHPEWVPYRLRAIKNTLWSRTAKYADHVITISEYSREEISIHFRLPKSQISVVPLGVDERWFQPVAAEKAERVRLKYSLPERYFLFIGTLQPRKNVRRVIEAHRSLQKALRQEFPLVVVGRAGWACEDVVSALNSESQLKFVRWLKYVPDEDLPAIFRSGVALVFPSLSEGFGLPVLEAFASGLPVITSKATALPEVAGDAAILINPLDTGEICESMQRIAESPELASTLRLRGIERARRFSWTYTAKKTVDIYRSVLGR